MVRWLSARCYHHHHHQNHQYYYHRYQHQTLAKAEPVRRRAGCRRGRAAQGPQERRGGREAAGWASCLVVNIVSRSDVGSLYFLFSKRVVHFLHHHISRFSSLAKVLIQNLNSITPTPSPSARWNTNPPLSLYQSLQCFTGASLICPSGRFSCCVAL